jgi:hypothetical protein
MASLDYCGSKLPLPPRYQGEAAHDDESPGTRRPCGRHAATPDYRVHLPPAATHPCFPGEKCTRSGGRDGRRHPVAAHVNGIRTGVSAESCALFPGDTIEPVRCHIAPTAPPPGTTSMPHRCRGNNINAISMLLAEPSPGGAADIRGATGITLPVSPALPGRPHPGGEAESSRLSPKITLSSAASASASCISWARSSMTFLR